MSCHEPVPRARTSSLRRSRPSSERRTSLSFLGPPLWAHWGNRISAPGAAVLVGIAVHGHVLPGVGGTLHQVQELAGASRMGDALVEVGEMAWESRPFADLQRLFHRVQKPVAEGVAQVGVIDAPQPGGLLGEADELIGVGVAAWGVVEPRGDPKGALLHPLAHHGPHVGEIGVGGRLLVPSHGADSNGGVADDVGDVHGHLVVEHGQVLSHRGPAAGEGWRPVQA